MNLRPEIRCRAAESRSCRRESEGEPSVSTANLLSCSVCPGFNIPSLPSLYLHGTFQWFLWFLFSLM